jgi:integrase/recombinase XerC
MPKRPDYPGHIQQRGAESWRITLRVDGERRRYTVKGTLRDAENYARKKYQELERRARRRGTASLSVVVRFSDLLRRFEDDEMPTLTAGTQRSYQGSVDVFRTYFIEEIDDPALDRIGRAEVKSFLSWRRTYSPREGRDAVGAHTVARDLRVLHRLFNYGLDMEMMELNPAARVRAPKADPRTPVLLTPDQLDKLLEAAGDDRPMLRLFLLTLAETGVRSASEALHLQWSDLDLPGGFLQVRSGRDGHRTKTGRSRWVPVAPRLRAALQDHAAAFRLATYNGKRSPWVFHHTRTHRKHVAGERVHDMRVAFENARTAAKLPKDLRMHDLRHRRITMWLAEGKDVVKVKEAVGHASLATTMSYTHLAREHLRDLVEDPAAERERLRELTAPAESA